MGEQINGVTSSGQPKPVRVDDDGNIKVNIAAGGTSGGATEENQELELVLLDTIADKLPAALDASGGLKVAQQTTAAAEDDANGVFATAAKVAVGAVYGLDLIGTSDAANAGVLRVGSGHVHLLHVKNANVAARFIALCDSATTPTASTPVKWFREVPALTDALSFGLNELGQQGFDFTAGVAFAYSTGIDFTTPGNPLVGTLGTAANHRAAAWGK